MHEYSIQETKNWYSVYDNEDFLVAKFKEYPDAREFVSLKEHSDD